jgi:hypothetical protein
MRVDNKKITCTLFLGVVDSTIFALILNTKILMACVGMSHSTSTVNDSVATSQYWKKIKFKFLNFFFKFKKKKKKKKKTLISSAGDECKPLNEMILSAKGEDKSWGKPKCQVPMFFVLFCSDLDSSAYLWMDLGFGQRIWKWGGEVYSANFWQHFWPVGVMG